MAEHARAGGHSGMDQSLSRHHLTEDDLAPARIAADHNISIRYLYKLLDKEGISLEQWIIERRLEGARTDLASPAGRARPIETVARAWASAIPASSPAASAAPTA